MSTLKTIMHQYTPTQHDPRRTAFTLVELIVVISIISVLAAITLPSMSRIWEERNLSDTRNKIAGLMRTASVKATGDRERGWFFYIDPETNKQRIAPIVSTFGDRYEPDNLPKLAQDAVNVFKIDEGTIHTIGAPYRVAPRSIFDEFRLDNPAFLLSANLRWSPDEIANENYKTDVDSPIDAQRHRNFFTVIFSADGRLRVDRPVLIQDTVLGNDGSWGSSDDEDESSEDRVGDIIGLEVHEAVHWSGLRSAECDAVSSMPPCQLTIIDPENMDLVTEMGSGNPTAINFPSVDGLAIYNDAQFQEQPTEEDKLTFIRRTAVPLFISRQTGTIIDGPVGESEKPTS
jgi:prepilin-type N-terminal cleavage/methylation domain-containing protein